MSHFFLRHDTTLLTLKNRRAQNITPITILRVVLMKPVVLSILPDDSDRSDNEESDIEQFEKLILIRIYFDFMHILVYIFVKYFVKHY
jgi:hypothetical protein